jgi:transcriptional regulator with XRE-family HTH domain
MITNLDKIKKEIGRRIRNARLNRCMTIEELAAALGISASYLGLVERGLRGTNTKLLVNVCEVLGCTLEDLVFGKKVSLHEGNGNDNELNMKRSSVNSLARTLGIQELNFVISTIKNLNAMKGKNGTSSDSGNSGECFY